jgi:hypothetical protein
MSDIKILIATHKNYTFPKSDIFLPVQVGKKIAKDKLKIQGDDEGDNISEKNPHYCELTAQYWFLKNQKTDIVGLFHYRRYFKFDEKSLFPKNGYPFDEKQINNYKIPESKINQLLNKYDIILARPDVFPYSVEIDYSSCHVSQDLDVLKHVVIEKHPSYRKSWEKYIERNNKLSPYNMFICKYELFEDYSNWMFELLSLAEKHIKISPYSYQQRIFGFLSERLLNLYCYHNNLKVKHLPIYYVGDPVEKNGTAESITSYLKKISYQVAFFFGKPRF